MTISDVSGNQSEENPYAPPVMVRAKFNPFHAEFTFSNDGIISRTGLVLPEICLTSGKLLQGNAIPLRFQIRNPSALNKIIQRFSFRTFIALPILLLISLAVGKRFLPQWLPTLDSAWFTVTGGVATMCGIIWAVMSRLARRIQIIGHISRNRYRWMVLTRFFSIALAISIVLPVPLPANNLIRLSLFGALLLHLCVVWPVLLRTGFAGITFRIRRVTADHVEVTGFTPAFLDALRLWVSLHNQGALRSDHTENTQRQVAG